MIDLFVTSNNIANHQAYTNSLVYIDKNTGQKTVIMPIFPNEKGEYTMTGNNLRNKQILENEGFIVKVVRDRAFTFYGNIHCLTLIAQNIPQEEQTCPIA